MKDKNKNSNYSPKNGPPERFQPKVLIIWLVIFVVIIAMWNLNPSQMAPQNSWTINRAIEAVKNDEVESLTMRPDPSSGPEYYVITGNLKSLGVELSDADVSSGGITPNVFTAKGRLTESKHNELADLSREKNIPFQEEPSSTLMYEILVGLLPFLLIIGLLYFLFVRQLRMAGRGAMSFGKSKAKMLTRDKDCMTFADVAGCDEAKKDVMEIVEFLKDPKKFETIGGRVPKGVLMVGPPGTGKTLLGKAVAGEADVPFFSISGSDFVEMFVGVGAARVRDMFEQGRKNAPCIVFIDEIDAVGRQRGAGLGGGNDEREQTLNSLLVEMDGFESHEGVIIIAATNRPDVLDSALLRPGRFDRQVTIDLPDLNGREQILKVHAKKIKMDNDVDLRLVARNTPGFSGADLANLLNEAALIGARFNKKRADMMDIEFAREKISFGSERRKLMDDEDKRMTAYHEAGHALVQSVIDDGSFPLHKVTIIPRGRALGLTMMSPKKDILGLSRKQLLNQICMAMAGRIGEEIETGDYSNGASQDIKQATNIARHMVCDWGMSDLGPVSFGENQDHVFLGREITRNQSYSEVTAREIDVAIRAIADEQYQRAQQIIEARRDKLNILGEALLEHETLEGKHVQEVLEHGEIRSSIATSEESKEEEDAKTESLDEDQSNLKENEDIDPSSEPAGMPA